MTRTLPVFVGHGADDVLVWQREGQLTARELLHTSRAVARSLPVHRYYINGCERRSTFLVAFLAALHREATTLLPMTRSESVAAQLARQYPDQVTLTDAMIEELMAAPGPPTTRFDAQLAADHVAAIVFTSGSTGTPHGHVKTWSTLLGTAELARERFLAHFARCNLVTTVPSQHMYGLETSIMLTLGGGCAVSDTRPFFPRDVVEELARIPEPRVLVTTPAHLRACVTADVAFPRVALVISATAPLATDLAADMERVSGAPVHEIYGCTEAGSMASRRTIDGDLWRPYRDSRVEAADEGARYVGAHLPGLVALQDVVEPAGEERFRLIGRSVDLVKIAGKRASLADLTQQLLSVDGVVDGVIFMPSDDGRCAALVVAPACTREQVMTALAARLDPAFMPRPLKLVSRLPRNETGKLPRAVLLAALEES